MKFGSFLRTALLIKTGPGAAAACYALGSLAFSLLSEVLGPEDDSDRAQAKPLQSQASSVISGVLSNLSAARYDHFKADLREQSNADVDRLIAAAFRVTLADCRSQIAGGQELLGDPYAEWFNLWDAHLAKAENDTFFGPGAASYATLLFQQAEGIGEVFTANEDNLDPLRWWSATETALLRWARLEQEEGGKSGPPPGDTLPDGLRDFLQHNLLNLIERACKLLMKSEQHRRAWIVFQQQSFAALQRVCQDTRVEVKVAFETLQVATQRLEVLLGKLGEEFSRMGAKVDKLVQALPPSGDYPVLKQLLDGWRIQWNQSTVVDGFSLGLCQIAAELLRRWEEWRSDRYAFETLLKNAMRVFMSDGPLFVAVARNLDEENCALLRAQLQAARELCATMTPPIVHRTSVVVSTVLRPVPEVVADLRPSFATNPLDALTAQIANRFHVGASRRFATELIRLISEYAATDPETALAAIWSEFSKISDASLAESRYRGLHVWSDEDSPPVMVVPGATITGQQPTLEDFRNGSICQRRAFLQVEWQMVEWMGSLSCESSLHRLPAGWILGRSGCGKSCGLFFLLWALHRKGFGPIVYLSSNVVRNAASVTDAVMWAADLAGSGHRAIVAFDQPSALLLDTRATEGLFRGLARQLVDRHEDREDHFRMPALVFAGSSEQAGLLKANHGNALAIHEIEFPQERPDDLHELRDWLGRRRPELRSTLVEVDVDPNTLAVQAIFEWTQGQTLREFSLRLRDERVSLAPGAVERVASILALNRLQLPFPAEAIERLILPGEEAAPRPTVAAVLRGLIQDRHLVLRESGIRGYWLGHPHLTDLIFRCWVDEPRDGIDEITSLTAGVLAYLQAPDIPEAGRAEVLWSVIRDLDGTKPILDPVSAVQSISDAFRTLGWREKVPGWLLSTCLELRKRFPSFLAEVRLAKEALREIETAPAGAKHLTPLCLTALETADSTEEIEGIWDVAVKRLCSNKGWADWGVICHRLLDMRGEAAVARVLEVCQARRGQPVIAQLLQRCLETGAAVEPIAAEAGQQLSGAPASPAWGSLCIALLRNSPATAPIAAVMGWVEANRDEVGICFVLAELLRRGVAEVDVCADQWLTKWSRYGAANFVLEPRLDSSPGNPILLRYARQWLRRDVGDNSRILERVIRQGGKSSLENYRLGLWWLQTHSPTHQSWFYVWRSVRTCFGPSVAQAAVGQAALRNLAPQFSAWGRLWLELTVMPPAPGFGRSDLVAGGKGWLRENPANSSWHLVWTALMESDGSAELEADGLQWLRARLGEANGWTKIWEVLLLRPSTAPAARRMAWEWLAGSVSDPQVWSGVWSRTFGRHLADDHLTDQLTEWLERSPVATQAIVALWKRVGASRGSKRLLDLALKWLEAYGQGAGGIDSTDWVPMWMDCWSQSPGDPRLLAVAGAFLLQTELQTGGAWEDLLARLLQWENREDWVRLAMNRLESEGTQSRGGALWSALWQSSSTREHRRRLREWGESWLATAITSPRWTPVWVQLWDDEEPSATLVALGLKRLRASVDGAWVEIWKRLEPRLSGTAEQRAVAEAILRFIPLDGWERSGAFDWLCNQRAEGDAKRILRERLQSTPKDAEDWPTAWQLALERLGEPDLRRAGRDWLATRLGSHVQWQAVWNALMKFLDERVRLEQLGANWLHASEGLHRSWPYVCRATLQTGHASARVQRIARDWLKDHLDHGLWPELWHELWKENVNDALLRGLAAEWMDAYSDHPAWQELVWWPIWSSEPGDERWRSAGRRWLKQVKPDHRSWHYVWKRLSGEGRSDAMLVMAALDWLHRAHHRHHSWGSVWLDVWFQGVNREELCEMGLSWLRGEYQRAANWVDVWKALRSFTQPDVVGDELDEIAGYALEQSEVDAQRWTLLWEAVHQLGKPGPELPIIGLRWLRSNTVDNYWVRVATLLSRSTPNRNVIVDAGLSRLARTETGPAFTRTWLTLRKFEPHSIALRERGIQRLKALMGEAVGWDEIWRALLASEAEEDMRAAIEMWLREADPSHRGWYWVWKTYLLYLEEIPVEASSLISMGRTWLMEDAPLSHVYWEKMWTDIRSRSSLPAELRAVDERGRCWLQEAPPNHIAWQFLWKTLWMEQPGSEMLTNFAQTWLARAPLSHESWQYVFSRLWEQRPGEPELVKLALRFLAVSRSHQSWVRCFEELWRWEPISPVYYELGVKWLRQNLLSEHREWSWLWEKLWKQRPDDTELPQLLMSWLVQSNQEHGAWTLLWQKSMDMPALRPMALKIGRQWLADRVRQWNSRPASMASQQERGA